MSKLVRQAIFALLGFIVALIGIFVVLGRNITTRAQTDAARQVHAEIAQGPTGLRPIDTVDVPLTNGTVFHVRECQQYWRGRLDETTDCRFFSDRYRQLTFLALGDPRQVAFEKDYWVAYRKSIRENLFQNALVSTRLGLRWGLLGGLCIWILYRIIHLGVRG
jgi:hypothetical protein